MKERPILFSAPMVRALLAGTKTQTRRVLKQAIGPSLSVGMDDDEPGVAELSWLYGEGPGYDVHESIKRVRCPYGQPGDQLWVRETWQGPIMSADEWERHGNDDPRSLPSRFNSPSYCEYAADGGPVPEFMTADDEFVCRWRPSIHMPRWASRITLEITEVRVERLQSISNDDLECEGLQETIDAGVDHDGFPRDAWRALWSSINGAESWQANPWVWVVSFKRLP